MPAEHILSHPVNGAHWCVRRGVRLDKDRPTIVYLHGFSGSSEDFRPLISCIGTTANWIAVDLPGHGKTGHLEAPESYALPVLLDGIHSIQQTAIDPDNVMLLGYSMGARIALHYLDAHRDCKGILISGSPGLRTHSEREQRIAADGVWIDRLMDPDVSIEDFCYEWEQQAVILRQLSLGEPERGEVFHRRRQNSKLGLEQSLRQMGTGALPDLWASLENLSHHLLITGELDSKFTRIAREMAELNPIFHQRTIVECGHAPHLENPGKTAEIIHDYIQCNSPQSSS